MVNFIIIASIDVEFGVLRSERTPASYDNNV